MPDKRTYNVKLLREIKKYPIIYNPYHADFNKQGRRQRSWERIATVVGISAHECRARWKNMRTTFRRWFVANERSTIKRNYYLHDEIKFCIPFLDISSLDPKNLPNASDDSISVLSDTSDIQAECAESKVRSQTNSITFVEVSGASTPIMDVKSIKQEKQEKNWNEKQQKSRPDKDRVMQSTEMFLLSYVETISALPSETRERFKIKMIELLLDIKSKYS